MGNARHFFYVLSHLAVAYRELGRLEQALAGCGATLEHLRRSSLTHAQLMAVALMSRSAKCRKACATWPIGDRPRSSTSPSSTSDGGESTLSCRISARKAAPSASRHLPGLPGSAWPPWRPVSRL